MLLPRPDISSSKTATKEFPRHLYLLDALRGLAALAVVLWHWQHFFFVGTEPAAGFQAARQPFYGTLQRIYTDGWRAVDLFFCLSGFIFFWLYAGEIAAGRLSWRRFAVLRLSRLYPLHLATLLFVAAAQFVFLRIDGRVFVFPHNDATHFALQAVLASGWGPGEILSFNGPSWSVSVEALLYGVFFVICVLGWRRWWHLVPWLAVGYLCIRHGEEMLGRGLFSFFTGGCTFLLSRWLLRRGSGKHVVLGLGLATGVLWVWTLLPTDAGLLSVVPWPATDGTGIWNTVQTRADQFLPRLVLYPLTILTLVMWEARRPDPARRWLAALGQISYSSYLLHFPLQMVFVATARSLGIPVEFFYAPWSLLIFFAVLLPLSLASFRFFELPCQTRIRAWLLPEPSPS